MCVDPVEWLDADLRLLRCVWRQNRNYIFYIVNQYKNIILQQDHCILGDAWKRIYNKSIYVFWLSALVAAWALILLYCCFLRLRVTRNSVEFSQQNTALYLRARFACSWSIITSLNLLLLKASILSAWSNSSDSFACAEVEHQVRSAKALTQDSIDFIEDVSVLVFLGLLSCNSAIILSRILVCSHSSLCIF